MAPELQGIPAPLSEIPRAPPRPGRLPASIKRSTIPGILSGALRRLELLTTELLAFTDNKAFKAPPLAPPPPELPGDEAARRISTSEPSFCAPRSVHRFDPMNLQERAKRLRGAQNNVTVDYVLDEMIETEALMACLGNGLPKGADDEALAEFVGDSHIQEEDFVLLGPVTGDEAETGQEGSMVGRAHLTWRLAVGSVCVCVGGGQLSCRGGKRWSEAKGRRDVLLPLPPPCFCPCPDPLLADFRNATTPSGNL